MGRDVELGEGRGCRAWRRSRRAEGEGIGEAIGDVWVGDGGEGP